MAEHCHLQELAALLGHILRMTTKCLRADSRLEWVTEPRIVVDMVKVTHYIAHKPLTRTEA